MADINNKPKMQLRTGISINGDKTPSPATKLLINHGKPNFTIQRSPKIQNGNPLSPTVQPKIEFVPTKNVFVPPQNEFVPPKNEFVVKSTTFNGVFKPSNISVASQQSLQRNDDDNEASKVVLRRAKVAEPSLKDGEDENVPEFIRRQRRIQERLAKENLDFENRRSGYFTQVLISPSSPNRKSFVETMSSPAIVPGLEMPAPAQPDKIDEHEDEQKHGQEQQREEDQKHEEEQKVEEIRKIEEEIRQVEENTPKILNEIAEEIVRVESPKEGLVTAVPIAFNGHDEEDEVNKAIEEVNKAVAGEDDDKPLLEETTELSEELQQAQPTIVAVEHVEETKPEEEPQVVAPMQVAVVTSALVLEEEKTTEESQQNGHVEAVVTSAPLIEDKPQEAQVEPKMNGVHEETLQNGHANGHDEITISHTNALSTPSLPSPDPSGEKGVNYEPKTVVSFSKDLGSEPNNYPDTVKVVKDVDSPATPADAELQELSKLKFEIKGNEQNLEVTSVLKTE